MEFSVWGASKHVCPGHVECPERVSAVAERLRALAVEGLVVEHESHRLATETGESSLARTQASSDVSLVDFTRSVGRQR